MITILTDPLPLGFYAVREPIWRVARAIRDRVKPLPAFMRSKFRGHFAVTRSLVEGLEKIGVPAAYNPRSLAGDAPVVIVLSGLRTLEQAIALKRQGKIARLIAGPNIINFPSDHPELIAAPEVDLCITPSPFTCRFYERECPALVGRCAAWPAGVDTSWWSPTKQRADRRGVLVFEKRRTTGGAHGDVNNYIAILKDRGYEVTLLPYWTWLPNDYRALLRECAFMVGFTNEESQGIAWSEAWSTDVPTLLWEQHEATYAHPRAVGRLFPTTTAPYLNSKAGMFFTSLQEFPAALDRFEQTLSTFRPREWVLEELSDEASARKLCQLAGIGI